MQVANEILRQLGGGRFTAMTGAKNFISASTGPAANTLTFRLPSTPHYTKDGINSVRITLDPSDTYTVEFFRIRGTSVKPIASVSDIYNDNLREVFTIYTGLHTSL